MQIFVRGLSGKHSVLNVLPWETVETLKADVEAREGVAASEQCLYFKGRMLVDCVKLEDYGLCKDSTVHLVLPLLGGKGGFGSNLRAAGKQKLTDNFDACRDLQGRRIRHKTAADKLEKWQAEAQERELEKVALKHLKELEKEERKHQIVEVDVKSVREDSKKTLAGVQSAVQYALQKNDKDNGVGGMGKAEQPKKRRKMDALYDSDGYNSNLSSSSGDEEEVKAPAAKKRNSSGGAAGSKRKSGAGK
ncbi:hypothetical protein Ndes2526B_g00490 [Nannochloris sp. 'desiccata']|nr:hypothetical protein KSW81_003808 [Chlorella desiccata (nom. nud.)]KAH7624306.1 putative Polyubiquitin [Chlorella desiccata (nom. nud.)]